MNLREAMRFFEEKTRASINIHTQHPAFLNSENLKLAPDQYLHHGHFCRFIKLGNEFKKCTVNKSATIRRAQKGRVFCSVCPFGLWEMAMPLVMNGELAAVLYLGHFTISGKPLRIPTGQHWTGGTPEPVTREKMKDLREAGKFLVSLIRLEIELWIASGGMKSRKRDETFYLDNTRRFIDCNFSKNIALSDLADILRVTPNHLGELIFEQSGRTFRELLNERRVKEAKVYLKLHRNLKIGQIAALCGFLDSNYFSTVFRKITGISPIQFRKSELSD